MSDLDRDDDAVLKDRILSVLRDAFVPLTRVEGDTNADLLEDLSHVMSNVQRDPAAEVNDQLSHLFSQAVRSTYESAEARTQILFSVNEARILNSMRLEALSKKAAQPRKIP